MVAKWCLLGSWPTWHPSSGGTRTKLIAKRVQVTAEAKVNRSRKQQLWSTAFGERLLQSVNTIGGPVRVGDQPRPEPCCTGLRVEGLGARKELMPVNDAPFDVRKELAQLFGTPPASVDEGIVRHLETSFNDPESLKGFLEPFLVTSSEAHRRTLDAFVEAFFHQRKRPESTFLPQKPGALAQPSATAASRQAGRQKPQPAIKASPRSTFHFSGDGRLKPQTPWTASKTASKKRLDGDRRDLKVLPPNDANASSGPFKLMASRETPGSRPAPPLINRTLCKCNAEYGPHALLGNCIRCGKIACSAMGAGPCLHCGNDIVLSPSAPPHLLAMEMAKNEGNVKNGIGRASDLDLEKDEALRKALEQKDRLLEYQKTSAQRTKVYDDATDWFSEAGNIWRSESDRLQLAATAMGETSRQNRDRYQRVVNIDLQTGRFIDAAKPAQPANEAVRAFLSNDQEWDSFQQERADTTVSSGPVPAATLWMTTTSKSLYDRLQQEGTKRETDYIKAHDGTRNPTAKVPTEIETLPEHIREELQNAPTAVEELTAFPSMENATGPRPGCAANNGAFSETYQQDPKVLLANSTDEGICLTLHQPWATLLVYGLKQAEFRSWPTSHRGRLWIHAASRVPTVAEIETQELRYAAQRSAEILDGLLPRLPTSYPTSALLGCVDVVDCVPGDSVGEADVSASIPVPNDPHESTSPDPKPASATGFTNEKTFAFLCQNPMRLLLPIPMSGGHKLWRLPRDRLAYFQRALKPVK